jgi:hypothetical protein
MTAKTVFAILVVSFLLPAFACSKKESKSSKDPAKGAKARKARAAPENPCKPGKVDRSSLHASVLFKTGMKQPKSKKKEMFDCAGKAITLYRYVFATPKEAAQEAMVMGARLWGGSGPSMRHRDEVMVHGSEVVVLSPQPGPLRAYLAKMDYKPYRGKRSSTSPSHGGATMPAPSGLPPELVKLHRAARCPSRRAPYRDWCHATLGWTRAKPAAIGPASKKDKTKVYVGFALPVATVKPINFNRLHLVALVVRKDGDKTFGKILIVRPENDKEKQMVAKTVFNISTVFKNRSREAAVPAPLLKFLQGVASKASFALTSSGNTWNLKGKLTARLRKAGPFWIALERAPKGLFVNLFTDRFKAVPAK